MSTNKDDTTPVPLVSERYINIEGKVSFVSALMLVAEGEYVLLKIEVSKGKWVTLIKERLDSPFSHIIEPNGISQAIRAYISQEIDNALKTKGR